MPLFLILVGLLLIVSAIRGTQKDLFEVLRDDFTGSGNYFVWVLAVGLIVMVGNIDKLRPVSNAFLWLVVIVIVLANRGLLPSFLEQVKAGTSGANVTNGLQRGGSAASIVPSFQQNISAQLNQFI